jgi:hypothetical protein
VTVEPRVVQARAPHALARALAATVVVVIGAVSAHTWAGGTVPTGPGLALVAAVVLAASLLLFMRDVPPWVLLPAVGVAQLGLHESFGLVAEHTHHATSSPDPGWTWQMVAAHGFVTLLTAVLWWAGRRAASYAVSFRGRPALPVVAELGRRRTEVRTRPSHVHLLVSPRRGPPLAVRPT